MVVLEAQSALALHYHSLPSNDISARTHFDVDVVLNAVPQILGVVEVAGYVRGRINYLRHWLVALCYEPLLDNRDHIRANEGDG